MFSQVIMRDIFVSSTISRSFTAHWGGAFYNSLFTVVTSQIGLRIRTNGWLDRTRNTSFVVPVGPILVFCTTTRCWGILNVNPSALATLQRGIPKLYLSCYKEVCCRIRCIPFQFFGTRLNDVAQPPGGQDSRHNTRTRYSCYRVAYVWKIITQAVWVRYFSTIRTS